MNASTTATIILSHGSHDQNGLIEFKKAFQVFESIADQPVLTYGFLELIQPTISDALTYVTHFPITTIILIQSFLLNANHTKNDIPKILKNFSQHHPKYHLKISKPLSANLQILELIKASITTVEQSSKTSISRENTLVILVGRGTSDPLANAWSLEVAQHLQNILKFKQIAVSFATSVEPKLQTVLKQADSSRTQRIIIVPLLLWSGTVYSRILESIHQGQAQKADIEWLVTPPLGTHPLLPHVWQDLSPLAQQASSIE